MTVAIVVFELHIPSARSLKDKRRTVRGLMDRLHQRHRISIAETGLHDLHQRSEITMAVVGNGVSQVERAVDLLRDRVEDLSEAWVSRWDTDILESSDP